MNLQINFSEISDFMEQRIGLRPIFSFVDNKAFEVSYKHNMFMPTIVVKFRIDAMRKDCICLSYECSNAASMIVAGVVAYLKDKIPSGIEVNNVDKRVNIYPLHFEHVNRVYEYVTLSDITFAEKSVNVGFTMV